MFLKGVWDRGVEQFLGKGVGLSDLSLLIHESDRGAGQFQIEILPSDRIDEECSRSRFGDWFST